VLDLTFIIADVIYGVQGEWLAPGWALGNVAVGVVNLGAGITSLVIAGNDEGEPFPLGLGIATSTLGAGFLAYGFSSAVLWEDEDGSAKIRPTLLLTQDVACGGAVVRW